jgi:hypothetical protein
MREWARENSTLLTASAALVGLVIFAISTFQDWLKDDRRYLMDGVATLFFLWLALKMLRRWRQKQLRM